MTSARSRAALEVSTVTADREKSDARTASGRGLSLSQTWAAPCGRENETRRSETEGGEKERATDEKSGKKKRRGGV